jgi:CheY-like chemotaxis protein
MPVLDGLAATRRIRAELGLAALPVIAFTAGVRDDQQAAARAAGADDVLPKPMDLEQMTQLLMRWIGPRTRAAAAPAPAPSGGPTGIVAPVPVHVPGMLEAVPAAIDFPALPGIDRARAMQRVGKDRSMFLGLLDMFIEDNAGVVAQTRADLARGDTDAAARRMHTLRSNAGFICALEIMEAAAALERAIEQGEPGEPGEPGGGGVSAGLDAIEARITAIVEAARALA